jgi:hypothetical protein
LALNQLSRYLSQNLVNDPLKLKSLSQLNLVTEMVNVLVVIHQGASRLLGIAVQTAEEELEIETTIAAIVNPNMFKPLARDIISGQWWPNFS